MPEQKPLCSIGSIVHVGDWSGVVEAITKDGVVLKLDNGNRLPVARKLIEEAVGK
jgi:hypothetical protein